MVTGLQLQDCQRASAEHENEGEEWDRKMRSEWEFQVTAPYNYHTPPPDSVEKVSEELLVSVRVLHRGSLRNTKLLRSVLGTSILGVELMSAVAG